MTDKKIIVTNDDGVYSPGLKLLYQAVKPLGKTTVLAPETPKSSSGLGITLHKPLRITRINLWGTQIYSINGTPSDIIHVALNEIEPEPSIVVSGINIGDNTSLQVILSSGTVGAAAQAALMNIPAIAFSAAIQSPEELQENTSYWKKIMHIARTITYRILSNGMPPNVDIINVNFPSEITSKTQAKVVPPARIRYTEYVIKRTDPRGTPYYWLYGKPTQIEPETDAYIVLNEKNIAITPISLTLYPCDNRIPNRLLPLAWEITKHLKTSP